PKVPPRTSVLLRPSAKDTTSTLATSNADKAVCTVNSTALPPGKTCGQRCVISPCASSVTGMGVPPLEGIRDRPLWALSAAMMFPSSPQLPPRPVGALHNVMVEPPSTEIFLNAPPLKNATHCPSGENNGAVAPPVAGNSVLLGWSNLRVKSLPCDTYTSRV